MYLSRMELHPRRRGARELLSSPGKMHGAVMDAFPRDLINEKRVLWRVDTLSDRSLLYIVSPDKPSFEHIQEQAGWANEQSWAIRDYTPLLQGIMRGQTYAFRLTANPTHTVTLENGQKKRLAHVTVKQQTQWLVDRAESMGLVFPEAEDWQNQPALSVVGREMAKFPRKGKTVTISKVTYEGLLEVRHADALRSVLTDGIGRAKAYGCGLLTIASVTG